jgi:hypothetical protein
MTQCITTFRDSVCHKLVLRISIINKSHPHKYYTRSPMSLDFCDIMGTGWFGLVPLVTVARCCRQLRSEPCADAAAVRWHGEAVIADDEMEELMRTCVRLAQRFSGKKLAIWHWLVNMVFSVYVSPPISTSSSPDVVAAVGDPAPVEHLAQGGGQMLY